MSESKRKQRDDAGIHAAFVIPKIIYIYSWGIHKHSDVHVSRTYKCEIVGKQRIEKKL